ncbi:MAG: S8/S53 family peptidase [Anaerolineales bacterium]|nr:S8/S53 family peptidase [Anaerolineales bacterium]
MQKISRITVFFVLTIIMISCGGPITEKPPTTELPNTKITRHPEPVDYSDLSIYTEHPVYDPNSTDPWQVDLRSSDLTKLDLSYSQEALSYATFDSKTKWPTAGKMPAGFNWQEIMELGKDPGLGIRSLHDAGITGKDVGIAIIDQTLLVDHIEYKDNIRVYEECDDITGGWLEVQMHGPAVASIAVGKTTGVAPDADLYYIATGDCGGSTGIEDLDFSCRAKAIQRIVEINKNLPANKKIRVLSMSIGWVPESKGYNEIKAALNEAKKEGIFVISSSLDLTYGLHFQGLGRTPLNDPNQPKSYSPGLWWEKDFFDGMRLNFQSGGTLRQTLLVPMDSRTTASPTGVNDYAFYRQGGWSWSIPYLAGIYALTAQVKPDITPEEFWETALNTGETIQIQHADKEYEFGVILNPQALIDALKSK